MSSDESPSSFELDEEPRFFATASSRDFDYAACPSQRLTQTSNTCWLNACLNCLFLSKNVSRLVAGQFVHLWWPEPVPPLAELATGRFDLRESLMVVVYHFAVKRGRQALPLGRDFLRSLGAALKCHYHGVPPTEADCRDPAFAEGGDPDFAIRAILETLFGEGEIAVASHATLAQAVRLWSRRDLANRRRAILGGRERPEPVSAKLARLRVASFRDGTPAPRILLLMGITGDLPRLLRYRGATYELSCAILQGRGGPEPENHVIAGINCAGNGLYTYDSNDLMVHIDWSVEANARRVWELSYGEIGLRFHMFSWVLYAIVSQQYLRRRQTIDK
jgi:hypothetical protein